MTKLKKTASYEIEFTPQEFVSLLQSKRSELENLDDRRDWSDPSARVGHANIRQQTKQGDLDLMEKCDELIDGLGEMIDSGYQKTIVVPRQGDFYPLVKKLIKDWKKNPEVALVSKDIGNKTKGVCCRTNVEIAEDLIEKMEETISAKSIHFILDAGLGKKFLEHLSECHFRDPFSEECQRIPQIYLKEGVFARLVKDGFGEQVYWQVNNDGAVVKELLSPSRPEERAYLLEKQSENLLKRVNYDLCSNSYKVETESYLLFSVPGVLEHFAENGYMKDLKNIYKRTAEHKDFSTALGDEEFCNMFEHLEQTVKELRTPKQNKKAKTEFNLR